jgi:hypothetical protein
MSSKIIDVVANSYPALSHIDGSTAILLTVLVLRIEGTKKAYAAIVPDNSRADPDYSEVREWVKSNGNPLRYEQAKLIWPMPVEMYAR